MKKDKITELIFNFYANSSNFNGILLSSLADKLEVEYQQLIPKIIELIEDDSISIQNGENPHIIRWGHYDKETQIGVVEKARNNKKKILDTIIPKGFPTEMEPIQIVIESHPVCVYPSPKYLEQHYSETKYGNLPFSKKLSLGEAQLTPVYFEIDVLDRYFSDPRYDFDFDDYSGSISVTDTEDIPSSLKESDQIFLKTFGLGYREDGVRVVVAYVCYLSDLSSEHQLFWNSKVVTAPCKMVAEYYENTIEGNWVLSQSVFSAIIEEQRLINEMTVLISGKPLFRNSFEERKRPKEFTFFTSPTLINYESFISLLDKMLSDNINKDFFQGEVDEFDTVQISEGVVERKIKGTIRLLEEWLKNKYIVEKESDFDAIFKPLKEVRKQRQNPAHRISENYYDEEFFKKQMNISEQVLSSLTLLRIIFGSHRLTSSVAIPDWIFYGNIKKF